MCNRQDNQTDEKIISAIENIMQLILVEEWDEAQRKLIQELSDCPNNVGLISVLPFINSKINLLDDNDNQKVLLYVSPDWRSQLELIRNRVLTNYYLKKCEESCCVSSEKELYSATTPLLEDVNYQSAMKYASVERKKELTAIQYKQTEQFILLCMKENNVSSETELQHVLLPLADNLNFQKAQKYTSPERQKDLLRIQNNQVEFFLQLCMKDNHVEREVELQYVPQVLSSNKNYQLAIKYASSERKVELKKIQYKQIEYLFKCFLYKHKSILSRAVEPLTQDKDYQTLP